MNNTVNGSILQKKYNKGRGQWIRGRGYGEKAGPQGYKTLFLFINVKMPTIINVNMPTIVGILTFMSGKNNILGLPEPKKSRFFNIFFYL